MKRYVSTKSYDLTEGGAIASFDGMVEITNSVFAQNVAGLGGAIAARGGELRVDDTEFLNNRSGTDMAVETRVAGVLELNKGTVIPGQKTIGRSGGQLESIIIEDGDGSVIYNAGGIVELSGTIRVFDSLDPGVVRISTDVPGLGDFTLVTDDDSPLIVVREAPVAAARLASLASGPEIAGASLAAAAPENALTSVASGELAFAGPLLVVGDGAPELADASSAFGAPTIAEGVITVVIAGLTVRFFGDDLTLDTAAFDFDNVLESLASLGGIVTEIVAEDANGVEVLRLTGLAIPAADIPATLATIGDGEFPNLLDLFGIAPAVQGGDGPDVLAGGGGDNLLLGGEGDDTYVFEGDFGADTVDETGSGGLDTLVFPDLAGPQALAVALTPDAVILSFVGMANRVNVLRGASGETGIELVRFGNEEATAFADLLIDAPPAPEAADDAAEVAEDGPPVVIDVLANDAGAGLTLISVAAPARGIARIEDGAVVFDPAGAFEFLKAGETATESFAYVIGDGVLTDTGEITVTVLGADEPVEGPTIIEGAPNQPRIEGTDGQDAILIGSSRSSQVFGGAEADIFVFGLTASDGVRDVAYLRDFQPGADAIDLSGAAFTLRTLGRDSVVTLATPDRDTLFVTGVTLTEADFTDAWTNRDPGLI